MKTCSGPMRFWLQVVRLFSMKPSQPCLRSNCCPWQERLRADTLQRLQLGGRSTETGQHLAGSLGIVQMLTLSTEHSRCHSDRGSLLPLRSLRSPQSSALLSPCPRRLQGCHLQKTAWVLLPCARAALDCRGGRASGKKLAAQR